MDEVRIRTKFMKSLIAKLVQKAIKKNVNKDIKILIDTLEAQFVDDQVTLKISTEITLNKNEFEAMLLNEGGH